MRLETLALWKIVAGAGLVACVASACAVENGEILHDRPGCWSAIESVSHGPTQDDWAYSRRQDRNLEIYLSEAACRRWQAVTKFRAKRLTVNGLPLGARGACAAGVSKAVLANFFPLPLPELPRSTSLSPMDEGAPLPGLDLR